MEGRSQEVGWVGNGWLGGRWMGGRWMGGRWMGGRGLVACLLVADGGWMGGQVGITLNYGKLEPAIFQLCRNSYVEPSLVS